MASGVRKRANQVEIAGCDHSDGLGVTDILWRRRQYWYGYHLVFLEGLMELISTILARRKARKHGATQCVNVAKPLRARSARKRGLQFGAAILGAIVCLQIAPGRVRAIQEYNLHVEQTALNLVLLASPLDPAAAFEYLGYLINRTKQIQQEIEYFNTHGGGDPLYGTVMALGSNPGNTVSVLAMRVGSGSGLTAAGWGDTDAGTFHAIRWTLSGGTQDLGTLAGAASYSIAYGISDDGSTIVGGSNTATGADAFRWTQAGGMQDLGSLQGSSAGSTAYAANSDGSVVVGQTDMPPLDNGNIYVPPHAFRWTQAGGMQDLGSLQGQTGSSTAYAVNSDGSVVVGTASVSNNGEHAFRWTQATGMQDLGTVGGLSLATATSVSGDGNTIVGYGDPTSISYGATGWALSSSSLPFRWTQASGLQDLNTVLANAGVNMTGTTITTAVSVTRDGAFIGGSIIYPTTPSGSIDTYLAHVCDVTDASVYACISHTAHDFNGDGYSDIAWRNTSTGDVAIWLINGTTILQASDFANVPTAANWSIVGQRDFNGDGYADFLWRNANGDTSIWLMNSTTISQATDLGIVPTAWTVAGTGDFNGDGYGDILWSNTSTGDVSIWLMTGTANSVSILQPTDFANVPLASGWTIAGTGDFNADGMTDILWTDTSTGDVSIWLMNGTTISQATDFANVPVASGWTIVGTGDFNGDGQSDILWRNTSTGDVAIWLMNGTTISQATDFANVPIASGWTVAETGDFNGDGMSDILWRNTSTGDVSVWLMNSTTISQATDFANVPVASDWTIQGLNSD